MNNLHERKIKPGETPSIPFNDKDTEEQKERLTKVYKHLSSFLELDHLPEMKEIITQYGDHYKKVLDKKSNYLNAQSNKYKSYNSINKIMNGIQKNCSEIFNVYKTQKYKLYRGVKKESNAFFGKPGINRKPSHSSTELDKIYNDLLLQNNVVARRDNSIFCTADRSQAAAFGTLYIIFPLNGFSYSYTSYADLIIDQKALSNGLKTDKLIQLKNLLNSTPEIRDYYLDITGRMSDKADIASYCWMSDVDAIKKMIFKKILTPETTSLITNMLDPELFAKNIELSTTNLEFALLNDKEIMINGAYYAINANYETEIDQYINAQQ